LWERFLDIDHFVRLHFVGFAAVMCLLGATSAGATLSPGELTSVLAVAVCFHIYAYVLNDVVDLPVDRTHPARQKDLLVRGAVGPGAALAFALVQIPLSAGIVWLSGGDALACGALGAGYLLMGIYDLWGKKFPLPPLTDLAQGLGWGCLAYVGAGLVGGSPSTLTHLLFAYGAAHIFLINGIHGGIRDLANDLRQQRVTTAAFLGARPEPDGGVRSTGRVLAFSMVLQSGLAVLLVLPVWANSYGYEGALHPVMLGLAVGLAGLLLFLAVRVARPELPGWDTAMRVHLFLIPFSLILLFLPTLGAPLALLVVVLYALPGMTIDFTQQLLARAWAWLVRTLRDERR
jgi:4-hydroxybenzoate polyprenyltransferase